MCTFYNLQFKGKTPLWTERDVAAKVLELFETYEMISFK